MLMEIIGGLITMAILMLLACGLGVVFAVAVYVMTRKQQWKKPTLTAGLFPPAVVAYLLACLIFSGIVSAFLGTPELLFGDIREMLPNGYELHALDKMPEAGSIQKSGDSFTAVGFIAELQTSSFMVLGKYDYTYFPRRPEESSRSFFLFDTRNGNIKNFAIKAELAEAAHTKLRLIPASRFHGPKTRLQNIAMDALLFISFFPPTAVAVLLLWGLQRYLKNAESPHLNDTPPPTLAT